MGAWVTQLVWHPTLDYGLGHDLRVEIQPCLGLCIQQGICWRFSPSPSLCLSLVLWLMLMLSLQNK